ncbi:hypothetical protein Mbo4_045 [Rhodococcus phage Mbo4]|uniref:Uncharacterized protein n=2 Tax=root TaxID=1 RepID=A0A9E7IH42_9CAUD|nr:hypothetical protein [Rhodococcus opacus]YP_010755950.1 hypothetical protein QEH50_gp45 [Rhodococcus phage Mbo4]EKT83072.1 hypothetical protein WSS_A09152 [Rhodococcus opacus M213]URG17535.1 hypothetical protein Mbo4_045 [Rhodococcus phage Mbo4]
MTEPSTAVVFDEQILWHLKPGTVVREIGKTGREFIVDTSPGRIWHGASLCRVGDLEMPVEVYRNTRRKKK